MDKVYDKNRKELIDEMLDKFGYIYCQHCQKSRNVYKFEVHHIIFRSEAPEHPEIHNKRNLIILCSKCHKEGKDSFHNQKNKRDYLIKSRKLDELFTWLKPNFTAQLTG